LIPLGLYQLSLPLHIYPNLTLSILFRTLFHYKIIFASFTLARSRFHLAILTFARVFHLVFRTEFWSFWSFITI